MAKSRKIECVYSILLFLDVRFSYLSNPKPILITSLKHFAILMRCFKLSLSLKKEFEFINVEQVIEKFLVYILSIAVIV